MYKKGTAGYRLRQQIEEQIDPEAGKFTRESFNTPMEAVVKILECCESIESNSFKLEIDPNNSMLGYAYEVDKDGETDRTYYFYEMGSGKYASLLVDADIPAILLAAIRYIVYWYKFEYLAPE